AAFGCSQRTSQITGTVRGATVAHVALGSIVTEVGADHRFKLNTDATGLVKLTFSGVGREPESVLIFLPKKGVPAEVDVTLAPPRYSADAAKPGVIGTFNDFRNDATAIPMSSSNGHFIA